MAATEKRRFTDKFLSELKNTGVRYEVWDAVQPGLKVRLGAKSGKAYYAHFRLGKGAGGKLIQRKIGDVASISLDDVRYRVGQIVTQARYNIDLLAQEEEAAKAAKDARDAEILAYHHAANPKNTEFLKTAWMSYVKLKKSSHAVKTNNNFKSRFRHFAELFGDDVKTKDLKVADLERLREHLGEKKVEFNATLAALSAVTNNEIYEGRIEKNVCKRVKPYPATYRDVVLTDDGFNDFVEYFSDLSNFKPHRHNYARFMLVMLYTGLRNTMLTSLMKQDNGKNNYLEGDVAVFRNHKTAHKKTKPERVKISKKAFEIMQDAMNATPESPYVLGSHDFREYYKLRPLNPTIIEKMANSVAEKFETEGDGKFTAYSLRHTFGTRAVEKGASIHAVSKAMLHTDLRTTMRYVKSTEKSREQMADFIDENF